MGGPVAGGVHCRLGGGHPEISGRSHSPRSLCDVKKVPQPSGVRSWITTPLPVSAPPVPVLGASTVTHTSQGSPSIDVLPPNEGVVLADVDSAGVNSESGSQGYDRSRRTVNSLRMGVSSNSIHSAGHSFSASILRIDGSCVLHPFTPHKLDVTMALELPLFLDALEDIRGISPDVQLDCEPWGHMDHSDGHCSCRSSDHTVAYVHELALMSRDGAMPASGGGRGGGAVTHSAGTSAWSVQSPAWCWDVRGRCLFFLIGPTLMAVFS